MRTATATPADARPTPRVTITISHSLRYQPPAHLVGKETTKRLAKVLFETTNRLGQRVTRADRRVYAGTPIQTEISAAADALDALKGRCDVRIITGSRDLAERPEAARRINTDC